MRHETEKQIAATIKAFKSVEAYLAQKKKLADAFAALDAKVAKTEEDHKTFMQKAGAREAQRLLGEANDADASSLDAGMLEIRDQRDRLEAARQALNLQQDALSGQSAGLLNQASQALSTLAGIVEADLNDELRQAALHVSSIVNKLYAFSIATHFGRTNNGITEIEIPSIVDGSNLFKRPARYHPLQNTLLDANWEKDAEAKALHDKLEAVGAMFKILDREGRERDYATQRLERERNADRQRASA